MSRKPNPAPKNTGAIVVLILLIIAMIAATGYMVKLCIDVAYRDPKPTTGSSENLFAPSQTATEPTETEAPPRNHHA